eukprot:350500-Chlamydomonas_euryale.AAC.9
MSDMLLDRQEVRCLEVFYLAKVGGAFLVEVYYLARAGGGFLVEVYIKKTTPCSTEVTQRAALPFKRMFLSG